MAQGIVQAATVSNSCVIETISVSASREAELNVIVVAGGERNVIGSIGCPKVEGVKVGNSNSMSVKTGKESSLSIGKKFEL